MGTGVNRCFSIKGKELANRYMKKCLSSLMGNADQNHNETALHIYEYGYIKKVQKQKVLVRLWRKGHLIYGWWECRQFLRKSIWKFCKRFLNRFTHDPATQISLDIYLKVAKIPIQSNICTTMFNEAIFTIANLPKGFKCPKKGR